MSEQTKPPPSRTVKLAANQIVNYILNNDSTISRLSLRMNRVNGNAIRDYDDECQYVTDPSPWDFWRWYKDDPFANKIVALMPKYCWQVQPLVYENKDGETKTAFEEAWDSLGSQLKTEKSYNKQESGSPVYEYLHRVDELAGVGRYGVLMIGLDDLKQGERPSKPAKFAPGETASRKVLYMRAYPEHLAKITQYDQDELSPRFGQPIMYQITLNDPSQTGSSLNSAPPQSTIDVHWTRVVHVAEGGEVLGVERMRACHRNVQALQKIYAASPEGYWKSCINILAVETNPQLGGDIDIDDNDVKDAMEAIMEGLKRYGLFKGTSLKSVGPTIVDPTAHIQAQIEAICIQKDIPKRIFMGSERGELASSQDDDSWNDVVKGRQVGWLLSGLLCPFIDRLINLNVLPVPGEGGYVAEWPDVESHSAADKAGISLTWTQAISAYVTSGANMLMTPFDFFTAILGMSDEDAQNIVDNATDAAGEDNPDGAASPLLGLVGGVTGMIEMYKTAREGAITEDQLRAMIKTFFQLSDDKIDALIADGIEPAPPPPTTIPDGAKVEGDLPGPIVKLPKPPPPKAIPPKKGKPANA